MTISHRQKQYLDAMGIPVWYARRDLPGAKAPVDVVQEETLTENNPLESFFEPKISPPNISPESEADWLRLKQSVSICTACDLHQSRTNTVFGVGNENADWMIIGEAPGQDEDRRGEPFVGKAGQLLNQMLIAIGLSREQVFIANILKCRPPNNRDPRPEEVVKCSDFLLQQIRHIKPKIILSVGRISAQNLLQKNDPIGRMRGQVYQHPTTSTPVIVTYHPAYLLRSPTEKRKAWSDLVLAKKTLQGLT